ncbi:MAG: transcriptional regulator [Desulfobacterium sp.]|nr:transcriptional regulator [Desulfobacterium sp.]
MTIFAILWHLMLCQAKKQLISGENIGHYLQEEVNMTKKQSIVSPDFPKKLKQLRQTKEWSQGQVAMKIGVDLQRISKYERGVLYPTTELVLKLADLFEVSLDYLLRDKSNPTANKINNLELFKQMEKADKLPSDKQKTLIAVLDAFIKQQKLEELMHE